MKYLEFGNRFFASGTAPGRFRASTLLLAALLLAAPLATQAVECIDYSYFIGITATLEMPGQAHDVALHGGYALVAASLELAVVDITDPSRPFVAASLPMDICLSVAVSGDYAYVGTLTDGVNVVDISDILDPRIVGNCPVENRVQDIEIRDGYAYLACDHLGVVILDLADPVAPQSYAVVDTPHWAQDVELQGHYAYVGDLQDLYVIDLDEIATKGSAAATGGDRPGPSIAYIAVEGDFVYGLDATFGINIYDVSDPMNRQLVNHIDGGGAGGIAVANGRLYAGSGYGLRIYDLDDPVNPEPLCDLNAGGDSQDLIVADEYVFIVSAYPGALDIIDASNLHSPEPLSRVHTYGDADDLALVLPHAYVSTGFGGLRVVDVSDPFAMVETGGVTGVERSEFCLVDGDRAYVAGGNYGLYVLDIDKPSRPLLISNLYLSRSSQHLDKRGDLVFVANGDGLRIIDVSDDLAPITIGELDTDDYSSYVRVIGDYALLSTSNATHVVDVAVPESPAIVATHDVSARCISVLDDLIYLGTDTGELEIRSIAALPDLPLVNEVAITGHPYDFAFEGDLAYAACVRGGLQVLDITDPTAPLRLGSGPCWAWGVEATDTCVFVTGSGDLISWPLHRTQTGTGDEAPGALEPVAARLHQNRPNPFNPTTVIACTLTRPATVRLSIHDVSGRAVRTLWDGVQLEAGRHELTWNGLDDRGRRVSSGAYLYRLEADGQAFARRMLLLK